MVIVVEAGLSSAKNKQIVVIGPELAASAWPHLEPLLEETRKYWELYFTLDSIWEGLRTGMLQLWFMNDENSFQLGMLTELIHYPTGVKQMHIMWLGGKHLKDALQFADYFERWAAKEGVSEIRAYARKGLERVLAPLGYEAKQVVLVKNIKEKMES